MYDNDLRVRVRDSWAQLGHIAEMPYPDTFGDERSLAFCALCGGETGTRDHVPSKVLLDDPLPDLAAVVPACEACNNRMSAHEDYLACAVELALKGTMEPTALRRKVRRILEHSPKLARRFALSFSEPRDLFGEAHSTPELSVERQRVVDVLVKLAKGHVLHELHEPQYLPPTSVSYTPLHVMPEVQRELFERPPDPSAWPEVGSRAMQRIVLEGGTKWIVVQPGRYRFLASTGGRVSVRMVLSEYLAADVVWET